MSRAEETDLVEIEWFRLEETSLSPPDGGRNESERHGEKLFT
jgi:hypothetical protein